jgi:hypothetical protein
MTVAGPSIPPVWTTSCFNRLFQKSGEHFQLAMGVSLDLTKLAQPVAFDHEKEIFL